MAEPVAGSRMVNGSQQNSWRRTLGRYAVLLAVFLAGLTGAFFVIFMQAWGDATCPGRTHVTTAMRWAIAAPTLILAIYCIGSGAYLRRVSGRAIHLIAWLSLAAIVVALGIWEWVNISPSEFCF